MSDEFHLVASTEQRDETRDLFYAQIGSRRNISALDEHLRERYSRYFEDYARRTAKRGRYRRVGRRAVSGLRLRSRGVANDIPLDFITTSAASRFG